MKKRIILILCLLGIQLQVKAQNQEVLFTVGKVQVTAEEFKAVYEKNKGVGNNIDPKTPEEYLDLYIILNLRLLKLINSSVIQVQNSLRNLVAIEPNWQSHI